MERLFGESGVSDAVRWGIADALLVLDRRHHTSRAPALKNDPNCPPEVITHLMQKLPI
jgi:hypothetical protein